MNPEKLQTIEIKEEKKKMSLAEMEQALAKVQADFAEIKADFSKFELVDDNPESKKLSNLYNLILEDYPKVIRQMEESIAVIKRMEEAKKPIICDGGEYEIIDRILQAVLRVENDKEEETADNIINKITEEYGNIGGEIKVSKDEIKAIWDNRPEGLKERQKQAKKVFGVFTEEGHIII